MSANKYRITTLLVLIMTSFSPLFSQNDVSIDNNIVSSSEEDPQFLLRTEHNGKTKNQYIIQEQPHLFYNNYYIILDL